jgi:hypothetical protein
VQSGRRDFPGFFGVLGDAAGYAQGFRRAFFDRFFEADFPGFPGARHVAGLYQGEKSVVAQLSQYRVIAAEAALLMRRERMRRDRAAAAKRSIAT